MRTWMVWVAGMLVLASLAAAAPPAAPAGGEPEVERCEFAPFGNLEPHVLINADLACSIRCNGGTTASVWAHGFNVEVELLCGGRNVHCSSGFTPDLDLYWCTNSATTAFSGSGWCFLRPGHLGVVRGAVWFSAGCTTN